MRARRAPNARNAASALARRLAVAAARRNPSPKAVPGRCRGLRGCAASRQAAGAGFGAMRLGAAFFACAAFFAAFFFGAALTTFFFLRAGAAFFFFPGFFFAFAFDFFAMIDLPICCQMRTERPPWRDPYLRHDATEPRSARCRGEARRAADTPAALRTRPPVAQSINSTVWTAGSSVPAAICVMQPILPAAITSGRNLSIVPTLRSRNLLAMSGCRIL